MKATYQKQLEMGTKFFTPLTYISNILGGMNGDTNWQAMKGKSGEADVLAGREFLDRLLP